MVQKYKLLEYFDNVDNLGVKITPKQKKKIEKFREELFKDIDMTINIDVKTDAIKAIHDTIDDYPFLTVEKMQLEEDILNALNLYDEEKTITYKEDVLKEEQCFPFENDVLKLLKKYGYNIEDNNHLTRVSIVCEVGELPEIGITTRNLPKNDRPKKTLRKIVED